jgi:hypothetical protein
MGFATRLVTPVATVALTAALAACGREDAPTAQSCVDRWNAETNTGYQATLAGAISASVSLDGAFRVGTWPKGEETVPFLSDKDSFSDGPASGRASVAKDSCLVVFPPSGRVGQMAFFEDDGKWYFARDTQSGFPAEARSTVAGAREVTPDALGKLKLK